MQRIYPDIQIKFQHLLTHMNEKNGIINQFISILKELCDTEIFYSRTLDKFANSISKLMIGKDPLKEIFIIFERIIAAKSQQSMEMANNIKDDMLPFIQKNAIDLKQQGQLKAQQKLVKDLRLNMQRKIKHLKLSQSAYKRSYEHLKKLGIAQTRGEIQQKQKYQRLFNQRQQSLIQTINIYNNTIQQYLLNYTNICQKLSQIETKRKLDLRDSINKYMIYQISYIKNLQYSIPRYMQSLGKMNDKLIIQDKIVQNHQINNDNQMFINLAKISINNYISNLSDKEKNDVSNAHKKIFQIKKKYNGVVQMHDYQELVQQLYKILDQALINYDVRVLKEVVYFARNVYSQVVFDQRPQLSSSTSLQQPQKKLIQISSLSSIPSSPQPQIKKSSHQLLKKPINKQLTLFLLDAILCHKIFQSPQFWNKYKQKLFDIIHKQGKKNIDTLNKEIQISLNFIAADLQFLKLVNYHTHPMEILSNFTIKDQIEASHKPNNNGVDKQFKQYIQKNIKYL